MPLKVLYKSIKSINYIYFVSKNFNRCFKTVRVNTNWQNVPRIKPKTMKIDQNVNFKELFTPELKILESLFKENNFELRIAGGAVRDLLIDKKPQDIDLASTATPEQMKEMFEREDIRMLNMKGEKHGTITARINEKTNFEITTLRIDVVTDGRRAEVQFTTDWQLDANRRDLTVNAMFLGLDGTVYDYFHGMEDLDQRRVAFVGDPVQRIQEDYLRILRYFRFYGRIAVEADKHDAEILTAIRENVGGLQNISGERLWSETRKILQGNFNLEIFLRMIDLGITSYLGFPSKLDVDEFRTVCQRACPLGAQPITLAVSLLKDELDVLNIHNRLHLSNYERGLALFLVNERDNGVEEPEETLIRHYQEMIFTFSNKAKLSDLKEYVCELFKYRGQARLLEVFGQWEIPKFPVSGHVIMEMGVPKGKQIMRILNELKTIWIKSNFQLTQEELKDMIPSLLEKLKEIK